MSVLPAIIDLEAYRGDTFEQTFTLIDAAGDPVDLTGQTVASWAALARNGDTPIVLPVELGADPGTVVLGLPDGMAADVYRYDLEVRDATRVTTWIRGRLLVEQDITNRDLP